MQSAMQNGLVEVSFLSNQDYSDPFNEVGFQVVITDSAGKEQTILGFWNGGRQWTFRFSSPRTGVFRYRTVCSDPTNAALHGQEGEIEITPYTGENPLYQHGPLIKSDNSRYLMHTDGSPFFWLGDTWWMGLTKRLRWPDDFLELIEDRVQKGFSVIQIVAGLYPDMDPFDERGANEAGFPWTRDFKTVNPEYFIQADRKMISLVEAGLIPCIVGCWGFFLDFAGEKVIKKHWDYLIARYGALPAVWCLAGEAIMPFYTHEAFGDSEKTKHYSAELRKGWTDIAKYVRDRDPFRRPITIHPTNYGHDMVEDPSMLDLDMLQTGHSSFYSLANSVSMIRESVQRQPALPVINSEVCYEGICGSSHHDIQRFLFWSCVLSGACGHTYGANGIWQINGREEPYGPSPHGATWGDTPWNEAYQLPGSKQVGLGKKLLERYPWWQFEQHPEWLEKHADDKQCVAPYAAGVPGQVRVMFLPVLGGLGWGEVLVKGLEPNVQYRAYYYDPVSGEEFDQGKVILDSKGNWRSGRITKFQDWVLVLEKVPSAD